MTLIAARLNAEVILVVTYPPPCPIPPFSPSPVSLTVSMDVKQRVYLLTSSTKRVFRKLLGTFNTSGRGWFRNKPGVHYQGNDTASLIHAE